MKYLPYCLITMLLFASPLNAQTSDIIVVANTSEKGITLTKNEVRNLFMGGLSRYQFEPVTLPPGKPTRVVFNTKVIGLTEARIQSYWAQMRFSGRSQPPKSIDDVDSLLAFVTANPGTVTYLPADAAVPDHLVVIYSTL